MLDTRWPARRSPGLDAFLRQLAAVLHVVAELGVEAVEAELAEIAVEAVAVLAVADFALDASEPAGQLGHLQVQLRDRVGEGGTEAALPCLRRGVRRRRRWGCDVTFQTSRTVAHPCPGAPHEHLNGVHRRDGGHRAQGVVRITCVGAFSSRKGRRFAPSGGSYMKIKKINLFDEVLLTTAFERGEPGKLEFSKAILDFLGRPFNPHLTVFADEVLAPHITAADRANRLWLPTAKSADVGRAFSRVSDDLVREWVKGIRPVTLQELDAQGWGVHAPEWRAVRQWVRLALRRNRGELRVDADTLVTLARHVIRKVYLPTSLEAVLPSVHLIRPLAMRWNRHTRRPDVRALFYFPDGCGAPDDTGQPILTHPPGLYWRGFEHEGPAAAQRGDVRPRRAPRADRGRPASHRDQA